MPHPVRHNLIHALRHLIPGCLLGFTRGTRSISQDPMMERWNVGWSPGLQSDFTL